MAVKTAGLWAPIIKSQRGEWVCWTCVRSTKREAKAEYLRDLPERIHKEHLSRVRFAKVVITEAVPNE